MAVFDYGWVILHYRRVGWAKRSVPIKAQILDRWAWVKPFAYQNPNPQSMGTGKTLCPSYSSL
jgi:hypothetical protein